VYFLIEWGIDSVLHVT